MATRIGILADDLTGASDTGLQFRQAGLRTWVVTRLPRAAEDLPGEVEVLSINTASRHLTGAQASERARDALAWLKSQGCRSFYKKLDSTLRGPMGAEIDALRRDLGSELAVVAPAFPEAGRTTLGGYQLVDGVPVSLTAYGQDPLYPVTESHLPTHLSRMGEPVGLIEWKTVLEGPAAIAAELFRMRTAEVRTVVVDAVRPEDLRALATAIHQAPYMILPAGSAGLASALVETRGALPLFARPEAPRGRLLGKLPPVFIVNGSANPVSLQQLEGLDADVRKVVVDVRQLLLTDDEEAERLARQVLQGLLAGKDVLLTTATSPDQVRRDQALGTDLGLSPFQVGHLLSEVMGRLVQRVVSQGEVTHLALVGGETAASVLSQLPGDRLEILSEVLPAIPCSQLIGTPLRIVTKSGGFGAPDALREIVSRMRLMDLDHESLRPRLR